MPINYFQESEKYRPDIIKNLLVGEAPPSSGKTYFYVPKALSDDIPIRDHRTLPATIFYHYFQTRPISKNEYTDLLLLLKKKGIFLIDIEKKEGSLVPKQLHKLRVEDRKITILFYDSFHGFIIVTPVY